MPSKPKSMSFEEKINALENIVSQIEAGKMTLEESLKAYEEGVKITRECREVLSKAEQKVEILAQENANKEAD